MEPRRTRAAGRGAGVATGARAAALGGAGRHDNLLPIDLDNPLAVDSLLQLLRSRDAATLTELYPGPDELMAHGPDGAYAHELIVPFIVHHAAPEARASAAATASAAAAPVVRTHAPGSARVFAKVYSGVGLADRLLLEQLAPLNKLLASDGGSTVVLRSLPGPDAHLRWRLQVRPARRRTVQRLVPSTATGDRPGPRAPAGLRYLRARTERYGGADGLERRRTGTRTTATRWSPSSRRSATVTMGESCAGAWGCSAGCVAG
jgi:hypothetical protein